MKRPASDYEYSPHPAWIKALRFPFSTTPTTTTILELDEWGSPGALGRDNWFLSEPWFIRLLLSRDKIRQRWIAGSGKQNPYGKTNIIRKITASKEALSLFHGRTLPIAFFEYNSVASRICAAMILVEFEWKVRGKWDKKVVFSVTSNALHQPLYTNSHIGVFQR